MHQQDATTLLDDDHNEAIRLFEQYKAAHESNHQRVLAARLCRELLVHMQIEEEIFYPAFQRATGDQELLKDAQKEHDEARELISQIQDAPENHRLVLELEDGILHHVNDEREKMFPKARATKGMDLMQLAQQLETRKAELSEGFPA
jgi:iron-sulfur cluster repair protein YtfE (RIC family)